MCKFSVESSSFASHFCISILEAFGWSIPYPSNIHDFLATLLIGHSLVVKEDYLACYYSCFFLELLEC